MKKMLTLLAILALGATTALAAGPSSIETDGFGADVEMGRAIFYSQPASTGPYNLSAGNSSVAYASEIADGIPNSLVGQSFNEVGVYGIQWGAAGVTPNGLYIRIYNGQCPPGQTAVTTHYFTWAQMTTVNQNDPSYWIYYMEAQLPAPITITTGMSIGFQMDTGTVQAAPYAGVLNTDIIYGCGEAYRDGAFWGYPRWTPYSQTSTTGPRDVAYSLGLETTATDNSTWSSVKALY